MSLFGVILKSFFFHKKNCKIFFKSVLRTQFFILEFLKAFNQRKISYNKWRVTKIFEKWKMYLHIRTLCGHSVPWPFLSRKSYFSCWTFLLFYTTKSYKISQKISKKEWNLKKIGTKKRPLWLQERFLYQKEFSELSGNASSDISLFFFKKNFNLFIFRGSHVPNQ